MLSALLVSVVYATLRVKRQEAREEELVQHLRADGVEVAEELPGSIALFCFFLGGRGAKKKLWVKLCL